MAIDSRTELETDIKDLLPIALVAEKIVNQSLLRDTHASVPLDTLSELHAALAGLQSLRERRLDAAMRAAANTPLVRREAV